MWDIMDVRKRKHDFGSAEKERKYNRCRNLDQYENKKTGTRFYPRFSSSVEKKSWGDMMDEEEYKHVGWNDKHPKSRRKIPLGEIESNKGAKNQRKAVLLAIEKDERKLATRQRQIDIGKNTPGYERYLEDVPRLDRTSEHPWTPNKFTVCSTRSWQGVMRLWRRKLHYWDPPEVVAERNQNSFFDISTSKTGSEVSPKTLIDNSMETDDCFSSGGSQASSIEDCKAYEDEFLFSLDGPKTDADLFMVPFA